MNFKPRPVHGLILGLIVVAVGVYLAQAGPGAVVSTKTVTPVGAKNTLREVDFGFAELDPGGQPVPIPSYKNGGTMVLYAGEELEFQALGDGPLPTIELRVGEQAQMLDVPSGRVKITGPLNRALPAVLLARGSRLSLPGAAPPRISVKVQVFGVARPEK